MHRTWGSNNRVDAGAIHGDGKDGGRSRSGMKQIKHLPAVSLGSPLKQGSRGAGYTSAEF